MNNPKTQPKPRKIHELIGKVFSKDLRKSYDHKDNCPQAKLKAGQKCSETNCYYGSTYYRLNVSLENSPVERIYVYSDLAEKEQIYQAIQASHYIDQRYVFFCFRSRKTGNYLLHNWRVLQPKEANHE